MQDYKLLWVTDQMEAVGARLPYTKALPADHVMEFSRGVP